MSTLLSAARDSGGERATSREVGVRPSPYSLRRAARRTNKHRTGTGVCELRSEETAQAAARGRLDCRSLLLSLRHCWACVDWCPSRRKPCASLRPSILRHSASCGKSCLRLTLSPCSSLDPTHHSIDRRLLGSSMCSVCEPMRCVRLRSLGSELHRLADGYAEYHSSI